MNLWIILFLLKISICKCLYFGKDDVIKLKPENFNAITESNKIWLINFYAPWSEESQHFVTHYQQVAKTLKGIINVAVVNCETRHYFCKQNGINTIPTLRFYNIIPLSGNYSDYMGVHTAEAILQSTVIAIRRRFEYNMDEIKIRQYKQSIIQLNSQNFDEHIMNSDLTWLVQFYSPSCGITRAFNTRFEKIARNLRHDLIYCGQIIVETNPDIVKAFNIESHPVFVYFPRGVKNTQSVQVYNGSIEESDLLTWALSVHDATLPLPTIYQMTSESVALNACADKKICIIIALPPVKHCNTSCKYEYLEIIYTLSKKYKTILWGWLWFEIGTQKAVESVLGIKDNEVPQLFAINIKDKTLMITKKPFTADEVELFFSRITLDQVVQREIKIKDLPKIYKTSLWDGETEIVVKLEEKVKDEL